MGQRTPLYDWHRRHGARLVDFAGWEMPLCYQSILAEHQAVRQHAGLFDISHMGRLEVRGPGALPLLQRVLTNDLSRLQEGQVRYSLICNEQGGTRDDVLVYRWPTYWLLVVNAGNRQKIFSWLQAQRRDEAVEVVDQTLATGMVAVQGPEAVARCRDLTSADPAALGWYRAVATTYRGQWCLLSRTGYTGEDGLELIVPVEQLHTLWEELVQRGLPPCGLGARDTLRLEAALPLYGHELTEEIDPFQAGLGWAVKLDKGEFIGREALERRRQDPTLPRRVGLELAGARLAREGAAVLGGDRVVGQVTSGTFAPTLGKAIALAYVEPSWTPVGTICKVDIRGRPETARVVPLPFYKRPRK
jgi:aminomethyltransferase